MTASLFINAHQPETLESLVTKIAAALQLRDATLRMSENSPNGKYYLFQALGFELKVSHADDSEFDDYEFWIWVDTTDYVESSNGFILGIAEVIGLRLVKAGFDVALALNSSIINGGRRILSSST